MRAKYYNGKTINEWSVECGLQRKTIADRLKRGWTIEEAVSIAYNTKREKEKSLNQIALENSMSPKTLKKRVRSGMTIEEALGYKNKRDLTGQRFGRLFVVEEIEQKRDPSGKPRRQYKCICDCGNEVCVLAENLVSGITKSCGCLAKELSSERRALDLTGRKFGYLTAIMPAFSDKLGVHWLCECVCGEQPIVTASNLTQGNTLSCGCYNLEKLSERKAEIAGQRFGIVTAIECVGQNEHKNYLWRCVCDCGTEFVVPASRLLTGETQSCGCVHSRAEQYIASFFSENDIAFKKNAYFDDLKLNGVLFFDFMIWDQLMRPHLIEYQGIQHYVEFPNGFGDQQRLITDPMKKKYCKEHNIPLYEIRYDEDLESKLKEIVAYVNPVLSSLEKV